MGVATLTTAKLTSGQQAGAELADRARVTSKGKQHFSVQLEAPQAERKIPKGLGGHRL